MDAFILLSSLANLILLLAVIALIMRSGKTASTVQLQHQLSALEKNQERLEKAVRDEIVLNRQESHAAAKQHREELSRSFQIMSQTLASTLASNQQNLLASIGEMSSQQKHLLDSFSRQLAELTQMNERKLDKVRATVEEKLTHLQEDNSKKLEQMRMTVDEKLHATLEQRLGDSFKLVSEKLEQVHKGLGEMQTLASGVGDLKKVLTNVKTRGTLGEIQLENLLEQIFTVEQYEKNVATRKGSSERVEFAIKLPSREESRPFIWLPIDSKFPLEDYQRLLEAQETGNVQMIAEAGKSLEARIKLEAKQIRDKYIEPPYTTDFAVMFLPIEGLYAEALRRTGLWEALQREYRVVITGPTTLAAFLNSLQMGFRTLAIQQRSSEVWQLLGAVKTEFGKFGDVLEKTQKKLQEASNTIETASVRTRAIERKLRSVQELPAADATRLLPEWEMTSVE